ncbi:MAG: UvrD-helicase domain-containing protein [Spirochaetia bacterium]|nr:UvrD-helicase domain-containing protein [Spirochaetia bacterium]
MYIIPKKYDAAKVRLSIKKKMAEEGKLSVIVPKLGTLYDVALEKSGLGKGTVIMKEDFFCLLDQIEELPDKFKNNNRNYKSAIFALLNEMAFDSEALDSYPFHGTVHAAGLTKEHCALIYKTVRSRGFLFRAEVYRKALEAIDGTTNSDSEKYYLISGEYYTNLEQQLLDKLRAEPLFTESVNQDICTAMFADDITENFQIPNPEKRVGFLRSDSVMEQYVEVKNHILASMRKDPSLKLDDFCLVTGDDSSLALCTSYYESIGFHPVSSASVQAETPLLEGLNIISYALSGDAEKLIRYYNRHHPDSDKVVYDQRFDFSEFERLSDFAFKIENLKKVPQQFKTWLGLLSDIPDKKQSALKKLLQLQGLLKKLGSDTGSLYEYESSLEQIFNDTDILLKDLVEYFKNILSGRKRTMISTWDDGVVLVKVGEYVPKCRYIYFADLEAGTFLKDRMPNLLLGSDEHDDLNRKVYGCTKEEHLKKWFASSTASARRIMFVIPDYNEGTVVSEYVENVLRLFPLKEQNVKILGSDIPDFAHRFCLSFKDVGWENEKPCGAMISAPCSFSPAVSASDTPREYVLKRLNTATRIEAFMKCPARFIYDLQQPEVQIQDTTFFDIGNAFHLFCEKFFAAHKLYYSPLTDELLEDEIGRYLSGVSFNDTLKNYFDDIDVRSIFAQVCQEYDDLKDTDLMAYLYFVCKCMKDKMQGCIPDSIRSEVFIGNAVLMENPHIRIGEGYIDMMFRKTDGSIMIVDFKSGNISDYKDDVAQLSNVQLLIYSQVVKNAVEKGDFSAFRPDPEQLDNIIKKKKDGFSVLEDDYFAGLSGSVPVEAYYLSYKGKYSKASGIPKTENQEPAELFNAKLSSLLDQAGGNIFNPTCNGSCTYCPLFPFCPDRENSMGLDAMYAKLNWQGPYFTGYPVPEQETQKQETGHPVQIVQFGGDKATAVSDTDHDIIISAGAGAGKTEVLTTRYLNLLLNTSAELEKILCITFTEKAAGEMKKRIFAKIGDTLSLGAFYSLPKGKEKENYTLDDSQRAKLCRIKKDFFRKNRISTFHSFCLDMLTQFEKENPSSSRDLVSTVAESYVIRDKKVKIVEKIIEDYSNKSELFKRWAQYQTIYSKNDLGERGLVVDILSLLENMKLSGIPFTQESRKYLRGEFEKRKGLAKEELLNEYKKVQGDLILALETFKESETLSRNLKKLDDEIARIKCGESGKETNYPYTKDPVLKSMVTHFKALPDPYGEENCTADEELSMHDILFQIILEADSRIEDYKCKSSVIELSDYHRNLISLIEKKPILDKIRSSLKYIMVDEFQDTNWLQKKILDSIHDSSNHVFFVGDLKQSIYRFQQCDNQIFRQYRDKSSMLYITFQENYRSVSPIVEFNNTYFSRNRIQEYCIIPNTSKDKNHIEYGIPIKQGSSEKTVTFVELGYQKGAFSNLGRAETNALSRFQEAFFIARTIAECGKEQYGKWGILIRDYGHVEQILEALRRFDIPYSFTIKRDFFKQPEIQQILLVLQVLYGFVGLSAISEEPVLSSFIASFDKKDKGLSYAVSSLMALPMYASVRPMIHELLIQCQSFEHEVGENPDEVLTRLLNFAQENSKEISTSARGNAVRIMTVHSSKGLEFDYLFVSKITDKTDRSSFGAENIGFINYVSPDGKSQLIDYNISGIKTLVKNESSQVYSTWIAEKNRTFEGEERGNLLYVAFTRAKKKLIVTMQCGVFKDGTENADITWLKNIRGNMNDFAGQCDIMRLELDQVEPVLVKKEKEQLVMDEVLEPVLPELATTSVSHYLDGLVEECDPDDKIVDFEELSESTGVKANEVGTAVHSFFERNVTDLASADPAQFDVPKAMQSQFMTFASAGLKDPGYRALVDGADTLMTEQAMIFRTPEGNLLNGVIDLIVRKGNAITVLDYKTHSGSSLDDGTLARYRNQIALYAQGLAPLYPDCTIDTCLLVMYSDGASELVRC